MENKNLEETDVNEKQKARNGKSAMPMRTCLVMILAGVYVAYLGVSLCQKIVEKHDGSMEYRSKKGVGTTVTVKIPL